MEFVRHRVFSFAQESTRYCNYSKGKFGYQLTCIIPSWLGLEEGSYSLKTIETRIAETSELVKNTETYMSKLKEFI